ncbi:MAG: type II toxin-antitoxin system Phd/YefM family antitoxin [Snowella sp.]|nr:type II toxin-antitoxin system Phd/YefM family antitoxin [Snowella sp.]
MTKYIPLTETNQSLLDLAKDITEEPLIITQEGQPIMTAMSYQKFESLMETLDILADQTFSQKLKESIEQVKHGETVSWETAKEKLGI